MDGLPNVQSRIPGCNVHASIRELWSPVSIILAQNEYTPQCPNMPHVKIDTFMTQFVICLKQSCICVCAIVRKYIALVKICQYRNGGLIVHFENLDLSCRHTTGRLGQAPITSEIYGFSSH